MTVIATAATASTIPAIRVLLMVKAPVVDRSGSDTQVPRCEIRANVPASADQRQVKPWLSGPACSGSAPPGPRHVGWRALRTFRPGEHTTLATTVTSDTG